MNLYSSKEEHLLYNEYIIADKKISNKSTLQMVLVPTLAYEPKSLTFKGTQNWPAQGIGELVWLSKKGTIKPVKYDMHKCDIMLVTGADVFNNNTKQLRIIGKGFGLQTLDLINEIEYTWQWKFYPTQLDDKILVTRDAGPDKNNDFKILRNFTMEKRIRNFFESQHQY